MFHVELIQIKLVESWNKSLFGLCDNSRNKMEYIEFGEKKVRTFFAVEDGCKDINP